MSESRRIEAGLALEEARRMTADLHVLDVSQEADRGRTSLATASRADPLRQGLASLCEYAVHRVDLTQHDGSCPKNGAVAVVPLRRLYDSAQSHAVTIARAKQALIEPFDQAMRHGSEVAR